MLDPKLIVNEVEKAFYVESGTLYEKNRLAYIVKVRGIAFYLINKLTLMDRQYLSTIFNLDRISVYNGIKATERLMREGGGIEFRIIHKLIDNLTQHPDY